MKGCVKRALELSCLVIFTWIILLGILIFIENIIMPIKINEPIIRGIFRVGTAFTLLALWLMMWWKGTILYYKRRVLKVPRGS